MQGDLIALASNFGLPGLIIIYLVWDRQFGRSERLAVDRSRAEADKALASALATLTLTIQHLEQRIK